MNCHEDEAWKKKAKGLKERESIIKFLNRGENGESEMNSY